MTISCLLIVIDICYKIVIIEMDDTGYLFDIIQHKYT